jgi:hypothetical protein
LISFHRTIAETPPPVENVVTGPWRYSGQMTKSTCRTMRSASLPKTLEFLIFSLPSMVQTDRLS